MTRDYNEFMCICCEDIVHEDLDCSPMGWSILEHEDLQDVSYEYEHLASFVDNNVEYWCCAMCSAIGLQRIEIFDSCSICKKVLKTDQDYYSTFSVSFVECVNKIIGSDFDTHTQNHIIFHYMKEYPEYACNVFSQFNSPSEIVHRCIDCQDLENISHSEYSKYWMTRYLLNLDPLPDELGFGFGKAIVKKNKQIRQTLKRKLKVNASIRKQKKNCVISLDRLSFYNIPTNDIKCIM